MSFKNTMKLFTSNFSLVWKQVFYFIVCFILFFICSYEIAKPIIEILRNNGVGSEIKLTVSSVYELQNNAFFSFFDIINHTIRLIIDHFKDIYLNLIFLAIFAFILPYIVFQMSSYNISSVMSKKLSMNMGVGYIQNFLGTLKSSFLYAISNIVLNIPFWAMKILILEIYLTFAKGIIASILGMVCMSGLYICIDSVKLTLFACYTGNYIETNTSTFKCFSKSVPLTLKNFGSIFSSSLILRLTINVVTGFVALFTFFSGLIIIIPASYVITSIFYVVVYFNKSGQRYYLGNNFIFNPVKYTVKQDEYAPKYPLSEEPVEEQVIKTISNNSSKKKKKK